MCVCVFLDEWATTVPPVITTELRILRQFGRADTMELITVN